MVYVRLFRLSHLPKTGWASNLDPHALLCYGMMKNLTGLRIGKVRAQESVSKCVEYVVSLVLKKVSTIQDVNPTRAVGEFI